LFFFFALLSHLYFCTGSDPNPLASAYMSTAAGLPQFGSTTALSSSPLASVALSTAAAAAAGKQIEGEWKARGEEGNIRKEWEG